MLATQDKYIEEATLRLHQLIEDQKIRDQLWAREDYIRCNKDREIYINTLEKSNVEKDTTIAKQNTTIAEQSTTISDMATKLANKDAVIADKDAVIAALKAKLDEKNQ